MMIQRNNFDKPAAAARTNIEGSSNSKKDSQEHRQDPYPFRLGYVTDVEGNLEYFESFVSKCSVFDHSKCKLSQGTMDLVLRDGCYFVYGGDAVDKGTGDIRLCRTLVQLKQRYPTRVFLLAGNRDLNKLRFTAELSNEDLERPIDDIPSPFWDPEAPTLRTYLQSIVDKATKTSTTTGNNVTIDTVNTRVNRIKYMLRHTLGCPDTFEFRRTELSILRRKTENDKNANVPPVTDEEVVDSFIYEVEHPKGSMHQYLQHSDIAAIVGNTLFIHGAVDRNTMQFVPKFDSKFKIPSKKPSPGKVCTTVSEWVQELNKYLRHGWDDYKRRPHWDPSRTTRGGESLMAIQNRPAMWGRSVVCNCYGDGGVITTPFAAQERLDPERLQEAEANPLAFEKVSSDPLDETVVSWLQQNGIARVMVGHKPTGDCPAVLSASYTGVEVVSADTSFSDTSYPHNTRGNALSIVEVAGNHPKDNHLEISGTLKTGDWYQNQFHRLFVDNDNNKIDTSIGDPLLGTKVANDWWVKACTTNSNTYVLCRGKGRQVEFQEVPADKIQSFLLRTVH